MASTGDGISIDEKARRVAGLLIFRFRFSVLARRNLVGYERLLLP